MTLLCLSALTQEGAHPVLFTHCFKYEHSGGLTFINIYSTYMRHAEECVYPHKHILMNAQIGLINGPVSTTAEV